LGDAHLNYALNGGEDFELLFAAPSEIESDLVRQFRTDFECGCTKIGEIRNLSDGIAIEFGDGCRQALVPKGYDHFA
jgi:thiamine monophosphate kinase